MKSWIVTCLCVFPMPVWASGLEALTFITEEYPPYNFQRDGKLQGRSVEILDAIFDLTETDLTTADIHYLPWARGYETTLNKPNTVLFSTTWTPSRNALFKWVGPIATDRVGLIARKDKGIEIESIDELNHSDYRLTAIREDIGEQSLEAAGVDMGQVREAISNTSALQMLTRDRVDLWAYSEDVALWIAEETGLDPANYESVYTLSESQLYFALHPDTNERLVATMQDALERLREQGVLEDILEP